jgi:hypothetical protein
VAAKFSGFCSSRIVFVVSPSRYDANFGIPCILELKRAEIIGAPFVRKGQELPFFDGDGGKQ